MVTVKVETIQSNDRKASKSRPLTIILIKLFYKLSNSADRASPVTFPSLLELSTEKKNNKKQRSFCN